MRIGVGLITLIDLGDWFYWAPEILSDQGLAPRVVESFFGVSHNRWSFLFLGGSTAFVRSWLGIHFLVTLALTLGFFPRVAAALCWILYLSFHHRVHFPMQASDAFIRTALFWMAWLPIGEQFVFWRRARGVPPRNVLSGVSVGLTLLVWWLYFGAAVAKLSDVAWLDGVAFYYALSVDEFPTAFAQAFLERMRDSLPWISPVMTYFVLALEAVVPWTLISPWRSAVLRLTGLGCLLVMQTIFALFLQLGLFHWQCWAVLLALVPSELWSRFSKGSAVPPLVTRWRTRDTAIVAALLALVADSALLSLRQPWGAPEWVRLPLQSIGYGGSWPMFTQTSTISQRWHEIRAHLADGSVVDLFRRGIPVRERNGPQRSEPTLVFNQRSMSLYRSTFPGGTWQFRKVSQYLCREWNAAAPASRQAGVLEFVMYRRDVAPYFIYGSTERSVRYRWLCGAEASD